VMDRLQMLVGLAEESGITLWHENEKEIYGDIATRCADIHTTIPSKNLRAAFDPANFVQCGVRPMDDAWPLLADVSTHIHIKDAMMADGHVVPAGEGDGQVRELLQALVARRYHGYLTLEPHLKAAGPFGGFTGPDLFHTAVEALRKLLKEVEGGAS
jgi:3-dehydroshikimate dehydratase